MAPAERQLWLASLDTLRLYISGEMEFSDPPPVVFFQPPPEIQAQQSPQNPFTPPGAA